MLLNRNLGSSAEIHLDAGERVLSRADSCSLDVRSHDGAVLGRCDNGVAMLSSQRIIFEAQHPVDSRATLASATFPLSLIKNAKYDQPWFFGSNSFVFDCGLQAAESQGAHVSITFNSRGGDTFMMQWAHMSARLETQRAPALPPDHPGHAAQVQYQQLVARQAAMIGHVVAGPHSSDGDATASSGGGDSFCGGSTENPPPHAYRTQGDTSGAVLVPVTDVVPPGEEVPPKYSAFEKKNE